LPAVRKTLVLLAALAAMSALAVPTTAHATPRPVPASGVTVRATVEHADRAATLAALAKVDAAIARAGSLGPLANGDGNACFDNLVINTTRAVVKVNACVGQLVNSLGNYFLYHYANIRCGIPNGGYQSCNFGLHDALLTTDTGLIVASNDAAKLNVQTWVFRGDTTCTGRAGYASQTQPLSTDERGFEIRVNATNQFYTGRTYVSGVYTGYPGC
jgi:hypothetical protein